MINFDWTITLGTILQVVIFISAGVAAYSNIIRRIDKIDFRVSVMWNTFQQRFHIDENSDAVGRR